MRFSFNKPDISGAIDVAQSAVQHIPKPTQTPANISSLTGTVANPSQAQPGFLNYGGIGPLPQGLNPYMNAMNPMMNPYGMNLYETSSYGMNPYMSMYRPPTSPYMYSNQMNPMYGDMSDFGGYNSWMNSYYRPMSSYMNPMMNSYSMMRPQMMNPYSSMMSSYGSMTRR